MWGCKSYWTQHWNWNDKSNPYTTAEWGGAYRTTATCGYATSAGYTNNTVTSHNIPVKVSSSVNGVPADEIVKIIECVEYLYDADKSWGGTAMENRVWNTGRMRHGRKTNTAFLDGHVDALQQSVKWNKTKHHYLTKAKDDE